MSYQQKNNCFNIQQNKAVSKQEHENKQRMLPNSNTLTIIQSAKMQIQNPKQSDSVFNSNVKQNFFRKNIVHTIKPIEDQQQQQYFLKRSSSQKRVQSAAQSKRKTSLLVETNQLNHTNENASNGNQVQRHNSDSIINNLQNNGKILGSISTQKSKDSISSKNDKWMLLNNQQQQRQVVPQVKIHKNMQFQNLDSIVNSKLQLSNSANKNDHATNEHGDAKNNIFKKSISENGSQKSHQSSFNDSQQQSPTKDQNGNNLITPQKENLQFQTNKQDQVSAFNLPGSQKQNEQNLGNQQKDLMSEISNQIKINRQNSQELAQQQEEFKQEIKLGELIGSGAYGKVYLGLMRKTGKFLAVKQIQFNLEIDAKQQECIKSFLSEIKLLQTLQHQNIVSYYNCLQKEDIIEIYMEYMPGGSMSQMLKQYGSFDEKIIKKFVRQLLNGLEYLHSKHVVHRDIKGGNILSDGNGNVKLADFGSAKLLENLPLMSLSQSELCESMKGSLYWMAPELLNNQGGGRKLDIWSLGCTIIEMATAQHPWPECKSFPELIFHVNTDKCPPIPQNLSDSCKEFIKLCCTFDKKERPSASQLKLHPYLQDD